MIREIIRHARNSARRTFEPLLPSTKKYAIGDIHITLNREHLLPQFQKNHRLYDRFLPVLCQHLDNDIGLIIDVGANVGDTTVAIAQVCSNPIFSIEGDAGFYELLRQNVDYVSDAKGRIRTIKALAGTGIYSGNLVSTGTTASRSEESLGSASSKLDDLLRSDGIALDSIALIKVDTDGFDADVLFSAASTLKASKPMLFWENQFSTAGQMAALEKLYPVLEDIGYDYAWIFDNFGNLLLEECSYRQIEDINKYVAAQQFHGIKKTILYTDVFATASKDVDAGRAAVRSFKSLITGG